jgi:microcompartment protein CcmK/EutM
MILAKVLAPVVSTAKHKSFISKIIFSVQPLDENLNTVGASYLAFDHVQAGEGDVVLICREGNGCRQMFQDHEAPVNAVISAIVDQISLENNGPL